MVSKSVISQTALPGESLSATDVECLIDQVCPAKDYRGKKVLLIVPDGTRTAPIGLLFKALYEQIGVVAKAFDVLIALGTHPPMSEAAICQRLDLTLEERAPKVRRRKRFQPRMEDFANREDEGVLLVPKAGETLFRLREPPAWAKAS